MQWKYKENDSGSYFMISERYALMCKISYAALLKYVKSGSVKINIRTI
jgi:hypothetical protein